MLQNIKQVISKFVFIFIMSISGHIVNAQQTLIHYLSGTDKDHTVNWEFFCSNGQNSGKWTMIPVPSNWELQGFGNYMYGNGAERSNEHGLYKHFFNASSEWKKGKVYIVFEGVMTDAEVKINGRLAGPVHQGGFYQFKYDVSKLINYQGSNNLEVKVNKESADSSVNRAERKGDFWALSGIYRPVYLEIVPQTFIEHVAIDARADGAITIKTLIKNQRRGDLLEGQIKTLDGENVGNTFTSKITSSDILLSSLAKNIQTWDPESPDLYQLQLSLKRNNVNVHTVNHRFGFRTVEVRAADGIYVNGVKIVFKGVNRHSSWPESGRTLSKEISLMDAKLIKEMNMNAVRMSHYPPDQHFLNVCDSLGLFVLNELTGWQAFYDTEVGIKRVKELVERDVNHPSIVLWANGNEGGWNPALDTEFDIYDIQKRKVYHPDGKFNGTDTKHYPIYNYVVNSTIYSNDIFFPTEFMHGLYDGGLGASLKDYWNLMKTHPHNAGAFLWVFADEGVVRTDKNGWIDTDGNHAPDGILGPFREKEASFYAIKEIWSPIVIDQKYIPQNFDGRIGVENKYLYSNLDKCTFKWKLVSFPLPYESDTSLISDTEGTLSNFKLAPGEKGYLQLSLPDSWRQSEGLYLTAYDKNQEELFTWSWPIWSPAKVTEKILLEKEHSSGAIIKKQEVDHLTIQNGEVTIQFNTKTGLVDKVVSHQTIVSLTGGPVMASASLSLKEFNHYAQKGNYIIETKFKGEGSLHLKWTFIPGKPIKLDFEYQQAGDADLIGITMNYPESKVTGMKWMGRGPYRVWKNRTEGLQFNVFHKKYNNTVTGESWEYPEFKGYHANLYWVTIENCERPFSIYSETDNIFFQMLHPEKPNGATNNFTSPAFPKNNLGFMYAIPPIGTKFQSPIDLGPRSQKNMQLNSSPIRGTLWFDFN